MQSLVTHYRVCSLLIQSYRRFTSQKHETSVFLGNSVFQHCVACFSQVKLHHLSTILWLYIGSLTTDDISKQNV